MADSTLCFWANLSAYWKYGRISLQDYLKNSLSHIFQNIRHDDDTAEVTEQDVEKWADYDLFAATVKLCMLRRFTPDPACEATLVNLLLECVCGNIHNLRAIERQAKTAVLDNPPFYHMMIAMALRQGNRNLVKQLVANSPPLPDCHLLFGPSNPVMVSSALRFNGTNSSYACSGTVDNGCDMWSAMIRAGWALPQDYMIFWAGHSRADEGAIEFLDTLASRGLEIKSGHFIYSMIGGETAVAEHILHLHTANPSSEPITGEEKFEALRIAAKSREMSVEKLEMLYKNGIRNLNSQDSLGSKGENLPDPLHLTEMMMNGDVPRQTPLHSAAFVGDVAAVEWLIQHGAVSKLDHFGNNPYHVAKEKGHSEVMAVFEKYKWKGSGDFGCGML